jgi:hypothetical protein
MSYERTGSNFGFGASLDILASNSEFGVPQAVVEVGRPRALPIEDTSTYIAATPIVEQTAPQLNDADLLRQLQQSRQAPVSIVPSADATHMARQQALLRIAQDAALQAALARPVAQTNVTADMAYVDPARNPQNFVDTPTRPTLPTVEMPTELPAAAPTKTLEQLTASVYVNEGKEVEITGRPLPNVPVVVEPIPREAELSIPTPYTAMIDVPNYIESKSIVSYPSVAPIDPAIAEKAAEAAYNAGVAAKQAEAAANVAKAKANAIPTSANITAAINANAMAKAAKAAADAEGGNTAGTRAPVVPPAASTSNAALVGGVALFAYWLLRR